PAIAILHAFHHALRQRFSACELPPSARQSLQAQRSKLPAAFLPEHVDALTQHPISHAIDESFVYAFRWVMGIGATLAGVIAIGALLLIGTATRKATFAGP